MRDHADGKELLIGVNDIKAAKGLKFEYEKFPNNSSAKQGLKFVEWSKE